MKIPNFHFSRCCDPMGRVESFEKDLQLSHVNFGISVHCRTMSSFRRKSLWQESKPRMCVQGNLDFCKKKKHSSSGLILYVLSSFLTWKIFIIFQVVAVGRFHSFTRSLLHFLLDIWKFGGGGGGDMSRNAGSGENGDFGKISSRLLVK